MFQPTDTDGKPKRDFLTDDGELVVPVELADTPDKPKGGAKPLLAQRPFWLGAGASFSVLLIALVVVVFIVNAQFSSPVRTDDRPRPTATAVVLRAEYPNDVLGMASNIFNSLGFVLPVITVGAMLGLAGHIVNAVNKVMR